MFLLEKPIAMADNKNKLSYLEDKLGVSREQVRAAIEAVGNNRKDVEAWLKEKG